MPKLESNRVRREDRRNLRNNLMSGVGRRSQAGVLAREKRDHSRLAKSR